MRNRRVEMRLNDEEFTTLNSRRGSLRLRTFARLAALNNTPAQVPQINRSALHELHRIGSNLNQIAHHLNSGNAPDITSTIHELQALRAALRLQLLEPK